MAEGDIHTSKQGDHWVNKAEGNQRASNSAPTKAEAQATGREMAIDRGVEHVILNCITLWNTVYLDAALTQLRDEGYPVRDEGRGSRPTCAGTSRWTGTTRSSSPISPVPVARCATPTPATTKSADRRRTTGAELLTARRAVPDVPAA